MAIPMGTQQHGNNSDCTWYAPLQSGFFIILLGVTSSYELSTLAQNLNRQLSE